MQGKITQIDRQRRILRVEGQDGVRYVADKSVLEDVDLDPLKEGDLLHFTPAEIKKGKEPKVYRIGEDRFESIILTPPPDYRKGGHQFRNPYSFIRTVKPLPEKEAEHKKAFVSHDRFTGLSGVIVCRLKTLTPFFTPDARTIFEDEKEGSETKGHKWMDYCSTEKPTEKLTEQPRLPMIPAATIRGVIRSVFEAATNSSFTAINADKLDRRSLPGEFKLAGRITKKPTENTAGEIQRMKAVRVRFELLDQAGDWVKDGVEAWAEISNDKKGNPFVSALHQQQPAQGKAKRGYLKLTGRKIIANEKGESLKFNERFFYEDKGTVPFSANEMEAYNELIAAQRERARRQRDSTENAAVAAEILQRDNHPLREGQLVYYLEKDGEATDLGYVAIPRRRYKRHVLDLLDPLFHPASDNEQLCPASRLFGFVRGDKGTASEKSTYAGRVSFSDASFSGEKIKYASPVTLEILSSPKPTSCEFYLANPDSPADVWVGVKYPKHRDYDDQKMQLRGRKFYWHQQDTGQYQWQEKEGMRKQNSQNATVRLLGAENEFRFVVHFVNLEAHELGALLWSLSLEKDMAHKLGMGKPIGLGSVAIEVESVCTIDRNARYSQMFTHTGDGLAEGKQAVADWQTLYLPKFRQWMEECFPGSFDDLPNIIDLRAVLRYPADNQLLTHYPLMENANTKNFEWFMKNREPEKIRKQQAQLLPFAVRVKDVPDHLKRWRRG